jgi:hypothetical protein
MKTTIAAAIAFLMMLGTLNAGGPGDPRPGATPAPPTIPSPPTTPAPTPRPGGTPAPAPVELECPKHDKGNNGAGHGKKKGWTKNPHNPHHPQSTNPGHAKHR